MSSFQSIARNYVSGPLKEMHSETLPEAQYFAGCFKQTVSALNCATPTCHCQNCQTFHQSYYWRLLIMFLFTYCLTATPHRTLSYVHISFVDCTLTSPNTRYNLRHLLILGYCRQGLHLRIMTFIYGLSTLGTWHVTGFFVLHITA